MEDANYNAVQGYQAFRVLKDLRIRRKELLSELENVQMITRQFNCGSMLEAYEEIETEMDGRGGYASEEDMDTDRAECENPIRVIS